MKRNRIKKEKVRVCVNLDKEIIEEIDQYITNLSGFINTTLKNYINRAKQLLEKQSDSDNNSLCKNYKEMEYKKRAQAQAQAQVYSDEPLEESLKWWE